MKVLSIAGKAELLAWLKLVERQFSPREVARSGLQTSEATVRLVNVRDWSDWSLVNVQFQQKQMVRFTLAYWHRQLEKLQLSLWA